MSDQLQQLLEENLKLMRETHALTRKLHRALVWNRAWGWVKAVFWVAVIVVSVYYSLPYVKMLQQLTGGQSPWGINVMDLLKSPGSTSGQLQAFQNLFGEGKVPTRSQAMQLLQSGPLRGLLNDPEIQKILSQLPNR